MNFLLLLGKNRNKIFIKMNNLIKFLKGNGIKFEDVNEIKMLNLSCKRLKKIPAEIGLLSQLQELHLRNNQLTQIPAEIGLLTQLRKLHLSNNQLTQIPREIGQLSQLQTLYLQNNKLTQIPREIGSLTQLQKLYLFSNQLTQIPAEIGLLTQLRRLHLYSNKLTKIPEEIGLLTQLQILYLFDNQLTQIPKEIGLLTQLQSLFLSNNQLTQIPKEIGLLTQLQILNLSNNQLTQIPLFIIYMINLRYFYYSSNEINNLHPAITRWLNRNKTTQNVYNNTQSVHDHNIEKTTNESIKKFITQHKFIQTEIFTLINNSTITEEVKNILKSYSSFDHIHSRLNLTFAEVLLPILDYINNHEDKEELTKILEEEMKASVGKCVQGRLSRLINVLSGYHEAININISDNEQIGNIVIKLKEKYTNKELNEFLEIFVNELKEREYDEDVIKEWRMYVEENY